MRLLRSLFLLSLVLVATACGRKDDLQHRVRNYDVVEEGSASGVTTSLGGEQPGSVPLTGTNVDTTTDLTLLPGTADTPVTGTAASGSLAETLEIDPAVPARTGAPPGGYRQSSPVAARREPPPQQSEPRSSRRTEPAREAPTPQTAGPEPAPPAEEPAAPPTSTTPTTTATQPEEPPPPPTTTSTQPQEPASSPESGLR